ncbi:hypothetical protein [Thermococcus peptonophilus]|uniref:hypothetical protein n=1 Tax=Thermococcus peptonophilus TaxID=53952 RepID=UPI000AC71FB3
MKQRKGELILWVTNPNTTKVEIDNEVELYEYIGYWQKLDPGGIVFLRKRIVLIPGETIEQKLPLELPPAGTG